MASWYFPHEEDDETKGAPLRDIEGDLITQRKAMASASRTSEGVVECCFPDNDDTAASFRFALCADIREPVEAARSGGRTG